MKEVEEDNNKKVKRERRRDEVGGGVCMYCCQFVLLCFVCLFFLTRVPMRWNSHDTAHFQRTRTRRLSSPLAPLSPLPPPPHIHAFRSLQSFGGTRREQGVGVATWKGRGGGNAHDASEEMRTSGLRGGGGFFGVLCVCGCEDSDSKGGNESSWARRQKKGVGSTWGRGRLWFTHAPPQPFSPPPPVQTCTTVSGKNPPFFPSIPRRKGGGCVGCDWGGGGCEGQFALLAVCGTRG